MPPVVSYEQVSVHYRLASGKLLPALNHLTLELQAGHILGLMGQSGCGKTTLARLLTRTVPFSGTVRFLGQDISQLSGSALRRYCAQMQYLYQNPSSAIAPHMSLQQYVLTPLLNLKGLTQRAALQQLLALMHEVQLDPKLLERRAAEVSLGQLQRLNLIRSLALTPQLLVCDEITSALDPESAQICLAVIKRAVTASGMSVLFITHDLTCAQDLCPKIAVMFKGKILEQGPADQLCHPYVQSLKQAAAVLAGHSNQLPNQNGAPTITCPMQQAKLCPWLMNCPQATEACLRQAPKLQLIAAGHALRCLLPHGRNQLP